MFKENAGAWEATSVIKGSQVSAERVEHKCANRGALGADIPGWAHQVPCASEFVKELSDGFELESRRNKLCI